MRTIVILVVAHLVWGCNSSSIDHSVREFIGKSVIISDSIVFMNNGTQYTRDYFDKADFKIINYIDTMGCEECKLHLFDWGRLQRRLDTLPVNVKVCFVVCSSDIENILHLSRIHRFNYPLLYDSVAVFQRSNNIPYVSGFRCCLVDSNNRVLLVGSPLYNESLLELYLENLCL